ncbi:integral membrane protein [Penicillium brasilianum]|uniref:Integral membrane protein n=1 Tax=Penicillium brasilianum TaxID=104259 RepID=A0A1S9RJZ8_PENBI|nr:integral membrane protein [Penicillium brasilianum]
MSSSSEASPGNWIVGSYTGNSDGVRVTIATFVGIAWYNVIELIVLIFLTFKRYQGPYFWSMLVSSIGILPYSVGYLIKFFGLTSATWVPVTLLTVGWWTMVTGQSFVLYSRLHLVQDNKRILLMVKGMIIMNIFLLHVPTTVLTFAANFSESPASVAGYDIMEKIQLTGFCVQEVIISSFYMWKTNRMLHDNSDPGSRKTILQLLAVNVSCILMDIALMVIEFMNFYIYQTTLKATLYSIKLKLEIAVLGKLVKIAHQNVYVSPFNPGHGHFPSYVDPALRAGDYSHPDSMEASRASKGREPGHEAMEFDDDVR